MSAAAIHIETMRAMLAMPSRDESLWQRLDANDRRGLLAMAQLPEGWSGRKWKSFTQAERVRMLDAVHRAGHWAHLIKGPV